MPDAGQALSLAVPQIVNTGASVVFTILSVWSFFWARANARRRATDPHAVFVTRFTLALATLGALLAIPAIFQPPRGGHRELADAARSAAVVACGVVALLITGARRDAVELARLEGRIKEMEGDLGGLVKSLADYRQQLEATRGNAAAAATVDAMTGLASRRLFDDVIARELRRAKRSERPMALAIAEIDHYEKYMKSFGHQQAEQLLKGIAKLFAAQARDTDLLVRFGEERLAILMPETDQEKAVEVTDWIRSMVANSPLPNRADMPGGRITVSAGVGAFPVPVADAGGFVKAVEAALVSAATEKNRVRTAS